jgi:hypothetical protein
MLNKKSNYIGWISQKERNPFTLALKKDEIFGFLERRYASQVQKNDILVIERPMNSETKIYSKVVGVKTFNKTATVLTERVDETIYVVTLKPFHEISKGYEGKVRPHDLDGHKLRFPEKDEIRKLFYIPESGVALGNVILNPHKNITFFYPVIPEDILYQSILIAGVQRSGKTNFVRLLARSLLSLSSKLPAVVILDIDGQFRTENFISKNNLPEEVKIFLEENKIKDINPCVLKLSEDPNEANTTLSLTGIKPEELTYLIPELPTKSAELVEEIIRECIRKIEEKEITVDNLRRFIVNEVFQNQIIHSEQKGAIIRAFYSPNLRLFDQPNLEPLTVSKLLISGKMTVIDVFNLSDRQKRAVALYLLLMFDCYKMNAPNVDPGLLFIVDECYRLFPKKVPKWEREYINRVVTKVSDIVHRGRKRKYGIILATQSPNDVDPLIRDLCNTKIAFRLEGAEKWVKDNFGDDYKDTIKNLPTGVCYINLRGTGWPMPTLPIKIPNVSDEKKFKYF